MKKKTRTIIILNFFMTLLISIGTAQAVDISFQPRIEIGLMQYSFESAAISSTAVSAPVNSNSGANYTQKAFEYADNLLLLGGGGTLFLNNVYLDFSGQAAINGNDSALTPFSMFYTDDETAANFVSAEPRYASSFDRTEFAVSLGYTFGRQFSVFAGYKRAKTEFETTYQGPVSSVRGEVPDSNIRSFDGRMWGDVNFDFEYDGPFVGAIQGWDLGENSILPGVLTVRLALAYLNGEVAVGRRTIQMGVSWVNDEPLPQELITQGDDAFSNRFNTEGDCLGYTVAIGWRGATPVAGLSYSLGVGGYRYEFEADNVGQSDINETTLIFKGGISYAF